jgi:hypothetical protein
MIKCRCGTFTRNGLKSFEVMILYTLYNEFWILTARVIQNEGYSIDFQLTVGKILYAPNENNP